jgi:hypothetical protein
MVGQAHGQLHRHHLHVVRRRRRSKWSQLRHWVTGTRLRELAVVLVVLTLAVLAAVFVATSGILPL